MDLEAMTRRKFLTQATHAAGLLAIHDLAGPVLSFGQALEDKVISFEEAVSNESLRQKYLTQLAQRIGKPGTVLDIVYDHDGTLSKVAEEQKQLQIIDDPKLFNRHLSEFLELYFKPEEREDARNKILNTSEGKGAFKKYILSTIPEQSAAYTHSNSNYFGSKSTIYVTKKVFEEWQVSNVTKEATYKPSEDILVAILQHEFVHADEIFNGMVLTDSIKVDNSNLFEVHPAIFSFISEMRAQLGSLQQTGKRYGKNDAYKFLLHNFTNHVTEFNMSMSHLRGELNPTPMDIKIYEFYASQAQAAIQEARAMGF